MMTNIDVKIRNPYNNCILRKIICHQYLPMLIGIFVSLGAQTDRLRYWNMDKANLTFKAKLASLQQHLPFTVCAEGCETAEEQRDDEVRTSQVPEQSEGKTKVLRQQYLPFTVLKRCFFVCIEVIRNNNTLQQHLPFTVLKHSFGNIGNISIASWLQQHTVCAEGCETAEKQSDDEAYTLQVPEWSEGKTKVMRK